jgi:ADP-ribosyltransferase exoenzyme
MMHNSIKSRLEEMKNNPQYNTVFPYLAIEEKAVINAYTDRQFLNLNALLRGVKFEDGHEKALKEISNLLSTALEKIIPPYNGGNAVYRGCYMSDEEITAFTEAHNNNDTVIHAYFTSSSKNPAKAFYDKDKNAMKIIKSKEGRLIMDLSVYPYEEEVLFNKQCQYKVTYINKTSARVFVHMEEI